jgi:lipoprotein NlpD
MAAARVPPAPAAPKPAPFETVSAQSASAPASQGAPAPGTVAEAARSASPKASGTPAAAPVAPPSLVATGDIPWRWPADGQVVSGYVGGDPTRQGIDIGGKSGDPVRAAADGTVVYSGNGLIGYGELIIVKHSPAFLSAYGHNRKRLVKEGDHVAAGQVIAEMGSSSASRDSLHFEIRKNGKPANPTDYLPRR